MAVNALSPIGTLRGKISPVGTLSGTLSASNGNVVIIEEKPYEGNDVYDISPKPFEEQTFQTAGKVLKNDVKVRSIPYYATSNTSGGSTVYIGREV